MDDEQETNTPRYQLMPVKLDDDLLRYAMECSGMNNPEGARRIEAIYHFLLEAARTSEDGKRQAVRQQTTQAMADCMDMVRQELIDAGLVGVDVPPMMLADAVIGRLRREQSALYAVVAMLREAVNRLDDILQGDDGQAYKEARKALPALRAALPSEGMPPLAAHEIAHIERVSVASLPGPGYMVLSALGVAARMCNNGLTMEARRHVEFAGALVEHFQIGMTEWPDDDQGFDREAERITRAAGLGDGQFNPNATSILDLFTDGDTSNSAEFDGIGDGKRYEAVSRRADPAAHDAALAESLAVLDRCPECFGQGIETDPPEPGQDDACKTCGGSGRRKSVTVTENGAVPVLYTCIGKGGRYELVGVACGAGTSRGTTVDVYRDVDTGVMYFRTPADFDERMQKIEDAG